MTRPGKTVAARSAPSVDDVAGVPDHALIVRPVAAHVPVASEIGAAMAHELSGPMTALLLYVGEIRRSADCIGDVSLRAVIESAYREAERIRALILRLGDSFEATAREDAPINSARNAIAWWAQVRRDGDPPRSDASSQTADDRGRSDEKALTRREREVLQLVTLGHSSKEGAALMKISHRTFECHRAVIMRKFGARNTAELVRMVMQKDAPGGATSGQPTA